MKKPSPYNGIVIVDKPAGVTSHDVVNTLRRLYKTKRVGHTGTLDPDATGVLVVCLGYATRVAEYLSAARKNYIAEVTFGVETDTQDASGRVLAECDASHLTRERVMEICGAFVGTISQVPPMVSALHHEGKRLYELAREGITVERAAREIQIDLCELREFTEGEHPTAKIEVSCSTGTYIRTLAADMGAMAGTGGMMRSLQRTWVGSATNRFALEEAFSLDALSKLSEENRLSKTVLPLRLALKDWLLLPLSSAALTRLFHGQTVPFAELPESPRSVVADSSLVGVLDTKGEVCAIAEFSEEGLKPSKVLAPSDFAAVDSTPNAELKEAKAY